MSFTKFPEVKYVVSRDAGERFASIRKEWEGYLDYMEIDENLKKDKKYAIEQLVVYPDVMEDVYFNNYDKLCGGKSLFSKTVLEQYMKKFNEFFGKLRGPISIYNDPKSYFLLATEKDSGKDADEIAIKIMSNFAVAVLITRTNAQKKTVLVDACIFDNIYEAKDYVTKLFILNRETFCTFAETYRTIKGSFLARGAKKDEKSLLAERKKEMFFCRVNDLLMQSELIASDDDQDKYDDYMGNCLDFFTFMQSMSYFANQDLYRKLICSKNKQEGVVFKCSEDGCFENATATIRFVETSAKNDEKDCTLYSPLYCEEHAQETEDFAETDKGFFGSKSKTYSYIFVETFFGIQVKNKDVSKISKIVQAKNFNWLSFFSVPAPTMEEIQKSMGVVVANKKRPLEEQKQKSSKKTKVVDLVASSTDEEKDPVGVCIHCNEKNATLNKLCDMCENKICYYCKQVGDCPNDWSINCTCDDMDKASDKQMIDCVNCGNFSHIDCIKERLVYQTKDLNQKQYTCHACAPDMKPQTKQPVEKTQSTKPVEKPAEKKKKVVAKSQKQVSTPAPKVSTSSTPKVSPPAPTVASKKKINVENLVEKVDVAAKVLKLLNHNQIQEHVDILNAINQIHVHKDKIEKFQQLIEANDYANAKKLKEELDEILKFDFEAITRHYQDNDFKPFTTDLKSFLSIPKSSLGSFEIGKATHNDFKQLKETISQTTKDLVELNDNIQNLEFYEIKDALNYTHPIQDLDTMTKKEIEFTSSVKQNAHRLDFSSEEIKKDLVEVLVCKQRIMLLQIVYKIIKNWIENEKKRKTDVDVYDFLNGIESKQEQDHNQPKTIDHKDFQSDEFIKELCTNEYMTFPIISSVCKFMDKERAVKVQQKVDFDNAIFSSMIKNEYINDQDLCGFIHKQVSNNVRFIFLNNKTYEDALKLVNDRIFSNVNKIKEKKTLHFIQKHIENIETYMNPFLFSIASIVEEAKDPAVLNFTFELDQQQQNDVQKQFPNVTVENIFHSLVMRTRMKDSKYKDYLMLPIGVNFHTENYRANFIYTKTNQQKIDKSTDLNPLVTKKDTSIFPILNLRDTLNIIKFFTSFINDCVAVNPQIVNYTFGKDFNMSKLITSSLFINNTHNIHQSSPFDLGDKFKLVPQRFENFIFAGSIFDDSQQSYTENALKWIKNYLISDVLISSEYNTLNYLPKQIQTLANDDEMNLEKFNDVLRVADIDLNCAYRGATQSQFLIANTETITHKILIDYQDKVLNKFKQISPEGPCDKKIFPSECSIDEQKINENENFTISKKDENKCFEYLFVNYNIINSTDDDNDESMDDILSIKTYAITFEFN